MKKTALVLSVLSLLTFSLKNASATDLGREVAVTTGCAVSAYSTEDSSAYASNGYSQVKGDQWIYRAWVWRSGYGIETNHSVSIAKSKDMVNWYNTCDQLLSNPITPKSAAVVDTVRKNSGVVNNITVSFDLQKRPIITYMKKDQASTAQIKPVQIYNARLESDRKWHIYQMTEWNNEYNPTGGGSQGSTDDSVGFSPVVVTPGSKMTQYFYRATNDKTGIPKNGNYEITNSLGFSTEKTIAQLTIPSVSEDTIRSLEKIVISSNPEVIPPKESMYRPSDWNKDTVPVIMRAASRERETLTLIPASGAISPKQKYFLSWQAMKANSDIPYDCKGNPLSGAANLSATTATDCPAYFVSSLYFWEYNEGSNSWSNTYIGKAWNGSQAKFDLLTVGNRQVIVYYSPSRHITVALRTIGQSWSNVPQKKLTSAPEHHFEGWDSHNYVTSYLQDDGTVHVAGNMHSYNGHITPIQYYRGHGFDVLKIYQQAAMSGSYEDSVTYPQFYKSPSSDAPIFEYRVGVSGSGDWYRKRYDSQAKTWFDQGRSIAGTISKTVASNKVIGQFEAFESETRLTFKAWACVPGSVDPVHIRLYVGGGPSTGGVVLNTGLTEYKSEAAVAKACGADGQTYRWVRTQNLNDIKAHSGKQIYVYGIYPGTNTHFPLGQVKAYYIP